MTGRKLKSVQELEEHGEQMVKIAKVKPKPKLKKKVVVMKKTPKLIHYLSWRIHRGSQGDQKEKRTRKMMTRSQLCIKQLMYKKNDVVAVRSRKF